MKTRVVLLALVLACGATSVDAQQRQPQRGQRDSPRVYKARIVPHWFQNNTRFWYRNNLPGGAQEFILVDAERGSRSAAFDHAKLAAGLSKAIGTTNYRGDRLPFTLIQFDREAKVVFFKIDDTTWKGDLASYECSKTEEKFEVEPEPDDDPGATRRRQRGAESSDRTSDTSPDGKWRASIKDHNLFIRSESDSKELQLSRMERKASPTGVLRGRPIPKRSSHSAPNLASAKRFTLSNPLRGRRSRQTANAPLLFARG
jgi:hypothetical protein